MLINGINYLPLVKMGMDEPGDRCGDIHNYRARTPGEIIPGKDNINYFLEFSRCDKYNYRTENKRTGAPLKKAIRELELKNAIATDTEYTTDSGSYRNLKLENEIRKTTRPYNIESILKIVNSISKEQFTKVIFLSDVIVRDFKTGDNFTPREIMRDYAKYNRIEEINDKYGNYFLKIRGKLCKYSHYEKTQHGDIMKVKLYLQEV